MTKQEAIAKIKKALAESEITNAKQTLANVNVKEKDVKDLPDPNRDRWDIAFNNGFQSRDRIRNPWTYIQLAMEIPNTNRTVLHDMVIHYYQ